MKFILGVGAVLTLLFWCVVIGNLIQPLAQPFTLLINLAGVLVLSAHVIELGYFNAIIQQRGNALVDRAKVLVFGVFYGYALKQTTAHAESIVASTSAAVFNIPAQASALPQAEPEGDSHKQLQMLFEPQVETEHA